MIKVKNQQDLQSPFDLVQFPSLGLFYKDKTPGVLVKYLSGVEENILTAPSLATTGEALDITLNSVILNEGIDPNDLLIGDKNTILMYLRSTSYGDSYPVFINCPKCNQSGQTSFNISSMNAKDIIEMPDEHGEYYYIMPRMKIKGEPVIVKFKPLTVADEKKINYEIEMEKTNPRSLPKAITIKYQNQITSINGNTNKEFIAKASSSFPIKDSSLLRAYMDRLEPGIDSKITLTCEKCMHTFNDDFVIGSDFLGLTPEYKNVLWEECFLLSYYSNGGVSRDEAMKMSTAERRWRIERISEEINRKNEAEKKASEAAARKK
jgi:hypothetical protein